MKRPKLWVIGAFTVLALSLSSCTTYLVVKKEVWPGVKQTIIGAGPHLVEALILDITTWIGAPIQLGEGILMPSEAKKVDPVKTSP